MIVAGDRKDTAMAGSAEGVGVLEHVPATVDARTLAIPETQNAVLSGTGRHVELLRTPDCSSRQVFVYTGLEMNVMRLQVRARLVKGEVEPTDRRTAIAGNEGSGIQTGLLVAAHLDYPQTNQRLGAVHEHLAFFGSVFVVQGNGAVAGSGFLDSHFSSWSAMSLRY